MIIFHLDNIEEKHIDLLKDVFRSYSGIKQFDVYIDTQEAYITTNGKYVPEYEIERKIEDLGIKVKFIENKTDW